MNRNGKLRSAFLVALVNAALGFVVGWVVAVALGVAERGLLAAVVAPILLGQQIGQLSTAQAVQYSIASGAADPRWVWRRGLLSALIAGLATIAVIALLAPILLREAPDQVRLLQLLSLTVPFTMMLNASRGALLATGRFDVVNAETIASPTLRLALVVGFQLTSGLTLTSAAWIIVASPLLVGVPLAALAAVEVRRAPRVDTGATTGRDFLRYQLSSAPGQTANNASRYLDRVLLGMGLVSPTQLGYYALAASITEPAASAFSNVKSIIFTRSARSRGVGDPATNRRVMAAAFAIAIGLVAVAPLVPFIYGDQYAGASLPLVILALAVPGAVARQLNTQILLAANKPRPQSVAQLLGLVVMVALLLVLAPLYGAVGAALASLVAYWSAAAVAAHFATSRGIHRQLPRHRDVTDVIALARGRSVE